MIAECLTKEEFRDTIVMPIVTEVGMITVSKGELKARMLEYFRRIEETGEELIVTSNREPVLRVTRLVQRRDPAVVFAGERGRVQYNGDILADTSAEWGL